jgi:hypothetical protein
LRQAEALPKGLVIKYHLAIALLPERELDPAASLKWVREGLQSMSPGTRKLIRSLNF